MCQKFKESKIHLVYMYRVKNVILSAVGCNKVNIAVCIVKVSNLGINFAKLL